MHWRTVLRNEVITYVTDVAQFIAELEAKASCYITTDEHTGKKSWTIETTPIVKSPNGTLAMSILSNEELTFVGTMTTIRSLGTYTDLFSVEDPNNEFAPAPAGTDLEVYQSVYPYHIPLTYTDENWVTVEYYLPKKIGEFAR